MTDKTNPIAKLMQTTDGRRLFGEKVEKPRRGKGSYRRKDKHCKKDDDQSCF